MIICLLFLLLTSCSPKILPVKKDSVYIEKLMPTEIPPDSSTIKALLECDENGRVILRHLEEENSKNVESQLIIDSLGNLIANMRTRRDTIYIPSKEVTKIVEIQKKDSLFQKIQNNSGIMAILLLVFILFKRR